MAHSIKKKSTARKYARKIATLADAIRMHSERESCGNWAYDHECEKRLRAIFSLATDAMLIINAFDHRVMDANQAALGLFRLSLSEICNIDYPKLTKDPDLTRHLLAEKYSYYTGIRHLKKGGQSFLADVSYYYPEMGACPVIHICVRNHGYNTQRLETMQQREQLMINNNQLEKRGQEDAFMMGEESERLRIARELHDHVGQLAISAKLSLEKVMLQDEFNQLMPMLETTLGQMSEVVNEIREVSHNMMCGMTRFESLQLALEDLIQQMSETTMLEISHQGFEAIETLKNFAQVNIYRIIEESLTNIIKHSDATHVDLNLSCKDDMITIEVRDNGKGVNRMPPLTSFGMCVMKYRANLLGGDIRFSSVAGGFFKSLITLPLSKWKQG